MTPGFRRAGGLAGGLGAALLVLAQIPVQGARWTLVQFGTNDVSSVTPYADWNRILRDPARTRFVNPDADPAHAGIVEAPDLPPGQPAWFGVEGTLPIQLVPGHRVIATFYNRSGEYGLLLARVSFTDYDAPDPADPARPWFTLQNGRYRDDGDWMPPGELVEMEYAVADAGRGNAIGGPASTGPCRRINVSLAEHDPRFVLTRIDLADDADRCPPGAPANLVATPHSTLVRTNAQDAGLVVRLRWSPPSDCPGAGATGVSRYLIYRDGALYDSVDRRTTSTLGNEPEYVDLDVAPGNTHAYEVSALDGALGGTYPVPGRMETRVGNEGPRSTPVRITLPPWDVPSLVDPDAQLVYLGVFRLPSETEPVFEESSSAMTFRPDGHPGFDPIRERSGSLYLYTHFSRELAELSIPLPSRSASPESWPRARLLRGPSDLWPVLYEIAGQPTSVPPGGTDYRVAGLGYHPAVGTVPALLYYGNCNFYGSEAGAPGHGWFALDLKTSGGAWFIGRPPPDHVYPGLTSRLIFPLPRSWAERHTGGRSLVVGDTFLSGGQVVANGPCLYAVAPWERGRLPAPGEAVSAVEMLRYSDAPALDRRVLNFRIDQFGHGAAWLVAGDRSALAIAYRRAMGDLWYGDSLGNNDAYHDIPEPVFGDKGAGVTRWKAGLLFYRPEDLAAVAAGTLPAWAPQPYRVFDLDRFSRRPDGGDGQHGGLAYDPESNQLFYIEHHGDPEFPSQPLVHVWQLRAGPAEARPALGIRQDGSQRVLTWTNAPSSSPARLEVAPSIPSATWEDLGNGTANPASPSTREYRIDPAMGNPRGFFRLVVGPSR